MSKSILIVEDDPTTIVFVKKKLERVGYNIYLAGNGKEALDIVRHNEVDLIVTDVLMPIMDGVDLYKELKGNYRTRDIPVIIITSDEVFKNSFHILGVEKFVSKPLDGDELLDTVEDVFVSSGQKNKKDILILGCEKEVTDEMKGLLEARDCVVKVEEEGEELISDALTMVPRLILVDIMSSKYNPVELIKALKCFSRLKLTKIVTYVYFTSEQMDDVVAVEELKDRSRLSINAGAKKFIGRFSKVTFIDSIYNYL